MTPLPMPDTTPPETRIYLVIFGLRPEASLSRNVYELSRTTRRRCQKTSKKKKLISAGKRDHASGSYADRKGRGNAIYVMRNSKVDANTNIDTMQMV